MIINKKKIKLLDCDKSKGRTFNKDFKSRGSYNLTGKFRMEYVGSLMELYSCTEAATKSPGKVRLVLNHGRITKK